MHELVNLKSITKIRLMLPGGLTRHWNNISVMWFRIHIPNRCKIYRLYWARQYVPDMMHMFLNLSKLNCIAILPNTWTRKCKWNTKKEKQKKPRK